ncbi:chorismate mutase [Methanococcoides sp. SA1]|nr:chorismate mutase [Methanococcoides sp. SA1]
MNDEILALRTEIDNLDKEIIQLLEDRFELTKEIGEIKKSENIQVKDNNREEQIIENRISQTGLNEKFITKIFSTIMEESRRLQK